MKEEKGVHILFPHPPPPFLTQIHGRLTWRRGQPRVWQKDFPEYRRRPGLWLKICCNFFAQCPVSFRRVAVSKLLPIQQYNSLFLA